MKGNLDAKKKIGILLKKNATNIGNEYEYYILARLAECLQELDYIIDELENKPMDPSFKSEIKSIIKQAMEERSL